MATMRCFACWPENDIQPFAHSPKTCSIPKKKDALIRAILARPGNTRAPAHLQSLLVAELKALYKKDFNLIPHHCNPTGPFDWFDVAVSFVGSEAG